MMSNSEKSPIQRFAVTNKKGEFILEDLPPGRYELHFSAEGYIPKTQSVIVSSGKRSRVDVGLEPITKASLKDENERLRGQVIASTILANIQSCVARSHALIDLSPPNHRRAALKEFKKTAKSAHNRIEELRSSESDFAVGAKVSLSGGLEGLLRRSSKKKTLA